MGHPDRDGSVDVVVGIVTHRRPASLRDLLERLALLRFGEAAAPRIAVVVVDNSPDLESRAVVQELSVRHPLPIEYVPLGAGNIASGRNEVLRVTCGRAPLVALIDDDEVPEPDWLHHLLAAQERTSADVVVGPVIAGYPEDAPSWLRRPAFHSEGSQAVAGWVHEAYTSNVLFRSGMVLGLSLSFDEALGVSGGEDQLFFRQANAGGARIYFEPAAVVHDPVARERLSVSYLLRREFRKGGTLGLLDRSRPGWPAGRPLLRIARAGWWTVTGITMIGSSIPTGDRGRSVAGLMRVARAAGMLHGLLGGIYDLYAAPVTRPRRGPRMVFVAAEGPEFQRAGHSRHLQGFLSHYAGAGYDVVVVVPGTRTGFLVRRLGAGVTYCAPSLLTIAGWQVVLAPRAIAEHVAWALFRRSPAMMQRLVDRVRTARRSRLQVDHVLGAWLSPALGRWVHRSLEQLAPHAVFFNSVFMVPDQLALPDSVQLSAVIAHDVVHERAASFRAAGHQVLPADFSSTWEAERLDMVDAVVAIQWDDAEALARLAPRARIVVSPVVVEAEPASREDAVAGRCLFVGSGSLHNVEAINWFLRECWPAIADAHPASELHVVGTVCARMNKVPEGVILRGEVGDLAEEYRRAQVAIAPLRTGSGLKVKVVESLCHGVATVTTSVGAQGLGRVRPRPYVLADTPSEFSGLVIDLLGDGGMRSRAEAAALSAAPLFSPARAYRELDEVLVVAGVANWSTTQEEQACSPVS